MTLTRHYDNAYLDLFPRKAGRIRLAGNMRPNPVIDVSTSKQISSGRFAGDVTVLLRDTPQLRDAAGGAKLIDALRDNDWAILSSVEAGVVSDLELLLLDSIQEQFRVAGGGVGVRYYTLRFRDWAKAIDDTEIWFSEWGNAPNVAGAGYFRLIQEQAAPPDVMCKQLVDTLLSPRAGIYGAWQLPSGLAWELASLVEALTIGRPRLALDRLAEPPGIHALIDTFSHVGRTRGTGYQISPPGSTFNLASLLKEWSNPILNELFFDLRPALRGRGLVPSMVMRECPFPVYEERATESAWGALPIVEVPRTAVLGTVLQRDGAARYNAFSFVPQAEGLAQVEANGIYAPTYVPSSIQRHGMRQYEVGSRFASALWGSGIGGDERVREVERWRWLMHSWHGPGPELKSGTIELRGAWPDIRVGRRLRVSRSDLPAVDPNQINAYISGVDRSWDPQGNWTTTATVERSYEGADSVVQRIVASHFLDLRSVVTAGSGEIAPWTVATGIGLERTTVVVPLARDVLSGVAGATLGGRLAPGSEPGAGG